MSLTYHKIDQQLAARNLLQLLSDATIYEVNQLLEGLADGRYSFDFITVIDWFAQKPQCKTTFSAHYATTWNRYDYAKSVRIKFIGGPPDCLCWFTGNLVTFICDRILYHATLFGTQAVTHILVPYGFVKKELGNG